MGWYRYQLGEQVSLLAGLVQVAARRVGQPARWAGMYQPSVQVIPAERAVQPAHPADTCASRASRSACSPGWYLYQPSKQVSLLTWLVPVPAERAGQPAHPAGACSSRASRSACSPGWYLYQPSEQVGLLAGLVQHQAGQPSCQATCAPALEGLAPVHQEPLASRCAPVHQEPLASRCVCTCSPGLSARRCIPARRGSG
ncbi:hypothetical protein PCASD_06341 [Puccinia coronata f. sp. avenae]|uniref:Uncharacterized protein n=1 Tax=Puccinia coronata f. sp. avenae TaxID=200324 RepID=A0A2N5V903_9BASI|nr:hypothetical protein PCASD_06341 [Puccinia coronata f. sp. avenae]